MAAQSWRSRKPEPFCGLESLTLRQDRLLLFTPRMASASPSFSVGPSLLFLICSRRRRYARLLGSFQGSLDQETLRETTTTRLSLSQVQASISAGAMEQSCLIDQLRVASPLHVQAVARPTLLRYLSGVSS